jgi:hypothetical protein
MNNTMLTTEDFILYLLKKVEPGKIDLLRLNKLAFFVEFGYIFKTNDQLSKAQYAGIPNGPVINDYADVLVRMEKQKMLVIDKVSHKVRPLKDPRMEIPVSIAGVIDPLIQKYSQLSTPELIHLSHDTDSYKITTNNERKMGRLIDKDLAHLETFFGEDVSTSEEVPDLPKVDKSKLVPYETRQ